ncbi:MAG: Ca-activated chloride channel [Solirubrobacteraceae bacterium]|nr:Ca-activated chloride channel [Solirubrobacteraceae bacterium]
MAPVSFAAPGYLLVLLAVPAAVYWYLGSQRRRRALVEAFAAPALAPSVMPRRPGFRRHLPMLVLLTAIVALILSIARPQLSAAVPVTGASIILATDVSGSMLATDVAPNRVSAAQRAANTFVLGVPKEVRIGVMEFNQSPTLLAPPSRNRIETFAALGHLQPGGGTAAGNAIEESLGILGALRTPTGKQAPGAIVLLSDGKTTSGADPLIAARDAARLHIPIYTVSLGTAQGTIAVRRRDGTTVDRAVPPDSAALAEIARLSGGSTFSAADAGRLSTVYQHLGQQLGRRTVQHQVAGYFVGSGLVLLLVSSGASLLWFGRLI